MLFHRFLGVGERTGRRGPHERWSGTFTPGACRQQPSRRRVQADGATDLPIGHLRPARFADEAAGAR